MKKCLNVTYARLKRLDIESLGRVMTQDIKMLTTSKKVPAPSLDKIELSSTMTGIFFLYLQRIKTEHSERKFLRTNVISVMSSTDFKVARMSKLLPTKG